jgi:hypothetical protein
MSEIGAEGASAATRVTLREKIGRLLPRSGEDISHPERKFLFGAANAEASRRKLVVAPLTFEDGKLVNKTFEMIKSKLRSNAVR